MNRHVQQQASKLPPRFWLSVGLATGATALVMSLLVAGVIVGLTAHQPPRVARAVYTKSQASPEFLRHLFEDHAATPPVRPRLAVEVMDWPVHKPEFVGRDTLIAEVAAEARPQPALEPVVVEAAAQHQATEPEPAPVLAESPSLQAPAVSLAQAVALEVERRLAGSEADLLAYLDQVPEISLESARNVRETLKIASPGSGRGSVTVNPAEMQLARLALNGVVANMLREQRAHGLPVELSNNVMSPLDALSLKLLSKQVREAGQPPASPGAVVTRVRATAPADADSLRRLFENNWRPGQIEKRLNVVPTLVQMLQVESEATRLELVKELSRVPGKQASTALAFRALFDGAPEVRSLSIKALKQRPREEYRPWLLRAFRYPWAPVADRAARALVELEDLQAVPYLVKLLPQTDPEQPVLDEQKREYHVRELVKINHLGSCCLCHAPALNDPETVRGLVPTPGEPLPVQYYEGAPGTFVRADVTFLRQDFSVMQSVASPGQWPSEQRFDYLVRTRKLTAAEARQHGLNFQKPQPRANVADVKTLYPQQQAVYYALSQLTGADLGLDPSDWQARLNRQAAPAAATVVALNAGGH